MLKGLKSLLPIAGAAAGYFLGDYAGSAAINAALEPGIGTLAAGGDPEDAIKNAILAGGAGAGLSSLGIGTGATGVAAQSAGAKAATQAATKAAATKVAAGEAAKGGLFGSGISAGDVALGSSLLGLLSGAEDEDITDEPVGETNPDYEGIPYKGLFVDPDTEIAYDTIEELEDAVNARKNLASGGIVALKEVAQLLPVKQGTSKVTGTGTSDSVDAAIFQNGKRVSEAALSDGEFVFREKSVVGAGNGDRELGAKRLYAMMDHFERMA